MALTIAQPWQCFTCHMDCAACHADDHTVPYDQYDHPPAFPDNDEDEDEDLSAKGKIGTKEEGDGVGSTEYVSVIPPGTH